MNGDSIVGELVRRLDGLRLGQFSGTASRTSVRISTWQLQPREDRSPPERAVLNVIDLTR